VVFAVWVQPEDGLHASFVQQSPSSQFVGPPGLQTPPPQISPVVHAFPSLHEPVLLVWTHPDDGLQVSVVQTLPSSHPSAGPPLQAPPPHVSFVVQAFPSSHGSPVGFTPLSWQPPLPSQKSWLMHCPPASPQVVDVGAWLGSHEPLIPVQ
jgi:hypothetical protein